MAKEYIEREAAVQICRKYAEECVDRALFGLADVANLCKADIGRIQPADVVPVVHGEWINVCGDRESPRQCSECLQDFDYIDGICYLVSGQRLPNYCPNCGAKMDGGADHD